VGATAAAAAAVRPRKSQINVMLSR